MLTLIMSDGGRKNPVSNGEDGVYTITDGRGDKSYFLTRVNVSPSGEISFGPAKGKLLLVDNQLSIDCRARLISANHRLVRGDLSATDAFIATGLLPLIMFSRKLIENLGSNPHKFLQHRGNVIAVPIKGKTDVSGVPIGAANAGGMLHRKHIDNAFTQELFLLEGLAKDYPHKDELLELIAPFSFNRRPVIMSVNLSGICPRLEASAVSKVYCAPEISNKFLREKFCKESRNKPAEQWEYNHIFLAGVLADCGMPLIFAKCDHDGILQAARSTSAPRISYSYVPDEIRGVEVSDANLGMTGQIWRRLSEQAAGYCDLGEVASGS